MNHPSEISNRIFHFLKCFHFAFFSASIVTQSIMIQEVCKYYYWFNTISLYIYKPVENVKSIKLLILHNGVQGKCIIKNILINNGAHNYREESRESSICQAGSQWVSDPTIRFVHIIAKYTKYMWENWTTKNAWENSRAESTTQRLHLNTFKAMQLFTMHARYFSYTQNSELHSIWPLARQTLTCAHTHTANRSWMATSCYFNDVLF